MSNNDYNPEQHREAPRPVERRIDVLSKALWFINQATADVVTPNIPPQPVIPVQTYPLEARDLNMSNLDQARLMASQHAVTMREGLDNAFKAA